jgi:predicted DNA-binding protein YlxM (UPF0122 family)/chaperonin cofactor prefoldin
MMNMVKIPTRRKRLTLRKVRTKSEKESRVIDLYENQDYTVSEICGEEHMSAATVTNIIKKFNKSKEPPMVSVRSQAFELFKSKTSLVDVAAKLDLSADETQKLYAEFQRLNGLNEYVMLYFKTEGDINEFLDCYNECQELRITPAMAMEALAMARSVASIERQRDTVAQELKDIQSTIPNAKEIRNNLEKGNEYLKSENELLKMDKHNLENDISELKHVEQEYENSDFHHAVRKIATEEATRILANKSIERIEARVAIAKVIRQNPELLSVLCPPSEGYYNFDLERKYNVLLDKSMDEGHREYMMMILPSVVTKLCAGIDEYHKNNKKQEGGTAGENSKA